MILVHAKGSTDPHGVQRTIMEYLARAKNYTAGQPEITAHVLAECQAHAIQHLESLHNSGAIAPQSHAPSLFALTPAGREWCRENNVKMRKVAQIDDESQEEQQDDASSTPESEPKKRGRPRRAAPAAE